MVPEMEFAQDAPRPRRRNLGDQEIFIISAKPGGNAEKILREMGKRFQGWLSALMPMGWYSRIGIPTCSGFIEVEQHDGVGVQIPLRLQLVEKPYGVGLFIEDAVSPNYHRNQSFSVNETAYNNYTIPVYEKLPERRVRHAADVILATWIFAGRQWIEAKRSAVIAREASKRQRIADQMSGSSLESFVPQGSTSPLPNTFVSRREVGFGLRTGHMWTHDVG
jgi:hypothetical protein